MENLFLYGALDLINVAQQKVLKARSTVEEDKAKSASRLDNTNKAFEHLNMARIYLKEAMAP